MMRPVGALRLRDSRMWHVADAGFRPLRESTGVLVAYVDSEVGQALAEAEAATINALQRRFWEASIPPKARNL
jgi:hypothetical protein